jgi:hypothetical protein
MRAARRQRWRRRLAVVLGLGAGLVLLAHPLAGAASDVWGNVGPASPLGANGLFGRYPLSHYALDQHFDAVSASLTGGVDASGVPPMIAYFLASVIWALTSFLANTLISLFAFAFSLDLVNGSEATSGAGALAPVSRAIHSIYSNVFGAPWLFLAVVVVGIWAMWKALVQRRYAETAGALGLSLLYVVVALFFVAQPAKTIGTASAWTNQMSQAFLAIAAHGNPSGGRAARDEGAQQLFDLLVFKPWVVLEFGGLEHCVLAGTGSADSDPDSVAVRPLSSDPVRDAALARRLGAGTEVSAEGKVCLNNAGKYAPHFLRFGPGTEERDEEYEALNEGDSSKLPGADTAKAGYPLGVADKPASDAMEEGGQYQRLLVAIVVFLVELGAFCLLGALSVGVILAQVLLLLLLAFAPVALVAAAIPGRGHDFFRGWLEKLAGFLLRKAAYSLILAVLLAVNGALASATAGLGWLMSFGLQGLFFWAVFLQRKTLTESLIGIATGPRAPGRDGTLRLLALYSGARGIMPPLRAAGHRARATAGAPGRLLGGGHKGGGTRTPRFGTRYSGPLGGGVPGRDIPGPSERSAAPSGEPAGKGRSGSQAAAAGTGSPAPDRPVSTMRGGRRAGGADARTAASLAAEEWEGARGKTPPRAASVEKAKPGRSPQGGGKRPTSQSAAPKKDSPSESPDSLRAELRAEREESLKSPKRPSETRPGSGSEPPKQRGRRHRRKGGGR